MTSKCSPSSPGAPSTTSTIKMLMNSSLDLPPFCPIWTNSNKSILRSQSSCQMTFTNLVSTSLLIGLMRSTIRCLDLSPATMKVMLRLSSMAIFQNRSTGLNRVWYHQSKIRVVAAHAGVSQLLDLSRVLFRLRMEHLDFFLSNS